jgi:tripartite-type tricarboxylate transporter receptor subunit TctC
MTIDRRHFSAAAAATALLPSLGWAESYPDRPIRLIVSFGPGSAADSIARVIGERLSERLHVPVVAENREGAGGAVGTAVAAKSAADGYTLLMGASPMTVAPHMISSAGFDAVRDFVPIYKVAQVPLLLITRPDAPYKTLKQLVEYARQNPGKLNYATSGNGSPSHLGVEMIRQATGINVVAVPYKNVGQAMADVLAGTVSFYFPALPGALPQVRGGKARALALGATERSPKLPEVPTVFEETGVHGLEVITWYGLMAPRGTPEAVTAKLQAEMARVMEGADTREKLVSTGVDVAVANAGDFAQQVRADDSRYGKLIRDLGLKE